MKPNWALLTLALGAFSIGTTEFSPMGLLPVIASGVDASIPAAGMLISAYAIGVMVGAPVMTLLLGRLRPRAALIVLMSIFTVGNMLSAIAPDYWSLLAARIITSLNHGAFFGLGAVFAANLVAPEKRASAVASMFMGLTIATIGGVPLATWIGQNIGWRMAFGGTAILGVITIAALYVAMPRGEKGTKPDIRRELAVLGRPAVLMALATTVAGAGAMFTLYTYIAPFLREITNAGAGFITLMLALIGVGFSIGNFIGGKFGDRSIDGSLIVTFSALIVIMLAFPLLAQTQIGAAIGLVLWGTATFALVPPVQMRVMQVAAEAPGLASSVNIGAFNLGNAVGAAVGGATIALDLGYGAVSFAGALLALAGLTLVLLGRGKQVVIDVPMTKTVLN
ncbi:MFS transporter [Paraburkholderia aspalathi]|nr:MFS transporter [Paraburkholderia aspalathi]